MRVNRLLSVKEAAPYVGLSVSTLNKMRCNGDGPRFVKLGRRRVAYDCADLDAWIEEQKKNSTSEQSPSEKPNSPKPRPLAR